LGGNSLLDILVFGRAAANDILGFLKKNRYHRPPNQDYIDRAYERFARWEKTGDGETVQSVRADLKKAMEDHCGVFRTEEIMQEGVEAIRAIRARIPDVRLQDHSKVFNTARVEALELENLADVAMATMRSAEARQESRGAHSRIDYPERDDARWMKHSLYSLEDDTLDYKPVRTKPMSVETFPPKKRVY
jgi:succinate dehydrogenase / fumarate reductase flavoprotein subunit